MLFLGGFCSAMVFHGAVDIAFGVPLGGGGELVVKLFAFTNPQFHLDT
jgi:hypothetical protein